jgi:hypothetical protein
MDCHGERGVWVVVRESKRHTTKHKKGRGRNWVPFENLRVTGLCKMIYESLPAPRHSVMRTIRVFIVILPCVITDQLSIEGR